MSSSPGKATSKPPARSSVGPGRRDVPHPGNRHLFADHSLPSYEEHAATLLTERVLSFLDGIK